MEDLSCKPVINLKNITCQLTSISQKTVTVVLTEISLLNAPVTFNISGIRNPYSTKPSQPFSNIKLLDADNNFEVSSPKGKVDGVTNKIARLIKSFELLQGDLSYDTVTNYVLKF